MPLELLCPFSLLKPLAFVRLTWSVPWRRAASLLQNTTTILQASTCVTYLIRRTARLRLVRACPSRHSLPSHAINMPFLSPPPPPPLRAPSPFSYYCRLFSLSFPASPLWSCSRRKLLQGNRFLPCMDYRTYCMLA